MQSPSSQAVEQAVQKKKRIILLKREMERARVAGSPTAQRGFLRRLVTSVVRPGQSRTPIETILALLAEVHYLSIILHSP